MITAHNLVQRQQEFMAHLLDESRPLPADWTARHAEGMDIYRNAYRARLVDAVRDTYERTARWVGEDAFRQAAAHHLINRPPNSWTLDDAGTGFPDTVQELFVHDPETAELARLEWAMHRAFVAADASPITAHDLGELAANFAEDDWGKMRVMLLPGTDLQPIRHDVGALWRSLGGEEDLRAEQRPEVISTEPMHLAVWRDGIKPVFMQIGDLEGRAMAMMHSGETYGAMCEFLLENLDEEAAVQEAGAMFGRWVHNGLIASVSR